eukprot:1176991-Prorocentrum_minimum.AAC.2
MTRVRTQGVAGKHLTTFALDGGGELLNTRKVLQAVGLHAAVKPLLSHSATGKFNSPPKYLRTCVVCRARHGHLTVRCCPVARACPNLTDISTYDL